MANDFNDFIKQIVQKPEADKEWVSTQLTQWKTYLEDFYKLIENILCENESIKIDYKEKSIFEESLGDYKVNSATISIGNIKLKLEPVVTLLIGSKGRVDLIGPKSKLLFVLKPEQENNAPDKKVVWSWNIATPPPNVSYLPLTKESFQDALMKVVNG